MKKPYVLCYRINGRGTIKARVPKGTMQDLKNLQANYAFRGDIYHAEIVEETENETLRN